MWLRTFQMIKYFILVVVFASALPLMAQVEKSDSLSTVKLKEVVVDADLQTIKASVSTYYPTLKQKNASQSGFDLLNRMAIPQLALGTDNSVNTVANQPVTVFIDGLPATADDLKNMRTEMSKGRLS